MVFFGRVGVEKKKLQKMRSFNLFFSSYMEHGCDAWRFSSHIAIMRLTKKHTKEVRVKRQKELSMVFLPLDFFLLLHILQEISPGCSLEGMMLKLKLQFFGHLMRRVDSLEKTDAGRDWRQEEKGTTQDEMAGWHY